MDKKNIYAVAIDGPGGAGKSTLAKALASELGILYVDTGAIYRCLGYGVRAHGVAPQDTPAVVALLPQMHIAMEHGQDGVQHMYLNGEDITDKIRTPEISMYASAVSAIPQVREFLLEMQRRFAREGSVIMDGRDIGTVVLPQAEVKIFLTAPTPVRARRRFLELQGRGDQTPYEQVLREMEERDYNDSHRAAAPLKQAEDAVLVDTGDLDFETSRQVLLDIVRKKVGA